MVVGVNRSDVPPVTIRTDASSLAAKLISVYRMRVNQSRENISPKEIENVINGIDGVVESSVVGLEDEKWGERAVAAVVVKADSVLNIQDIQARCREALHDWKCPKAFLLVEQLPKNTMGKVLHDEVKKLFNRP